MSGRAVGYAEIDLVGYFGPGRNIGQAACRAGVMVRVIEVVPVLGKRRGEDRHEHDERQQTGGEAIERRTGGR